jgi:hypothetical protein
MIILTATSYQKLIDKIHSDMTLGCTTINTSTKNPPKICLRHPDMKNINTFKLSRISYKMVRTNQIGLKLELNQYLEE